MKAVFFCLIVMIVSLGASPAQATLLESFENDLSNWVDLSGPVGPLGPDAALVGSLVTDDLTYFATEGNSFLRLRAGTPNGLPAEQDTQTHVVSQSFLVNPGDSITFDVAWLGNDALPYNDSAFMRYRLDGKPALDFTWSIKDNGDGYSTPWLPMSFFMGGIEEQTLVWIEFSVRNDKDSMLDSFLLIDNIRHEKASSVPEPASAMLLLSSLGLLVAKRNRR